MSERQFRRAQTLFGLVWRCGGRAPRASALRDLRPRDMMIDIQSFLWFWVVPERTPAPGRKWLQDIVSGKATDVEGTAAREGRGTRSVT
jgi:hypothetical protein